MSIATNGKVYYTVFALSHCRGGVQCQKQSSLSSSSLFPPSNTHKYKRPTRTKDLFASKHRQTTSTTCQCRPAVNVYVPQHTRGDVLVMCGPLPCVHTTLGGLTSWHASPCRPVGGDVRHPRHVWPSVGVRCSLGCGRWGGGRGGGGVYLNMLILFCWLRSNLVHHLCLGTAGIFKALKPSSIKIKQLFGRVEILNQVRIKEDGFPLVQRAINRTVSIYLEGYLYYYYYNTASLNPIK